MLQDSHTTSLLILGMELGPQNVPSLCRETNGTLRASSGTAGTMGCIYCLEAQRAVQQARASRSVSSASIAARGPSIDWVLPAVARLTGACYLHACTLAQPYAAFDVRSLVSASRDAEAAGRGVFEEGGRAEQDHE